MKRDPVVLLLVAMAITVMLVFGFHMARQSRSSTVGDMKGQPAPEFALESLDGQTVHLSDFHGKAILLNFWATWCEPCKIEMPWFVDLQKQYGPDGFQVIGIAMDDASKEDIAKFAKQMGVNYPILIGKEAVGDSYGGLPFLPATFYIGRDGKVIDKIFGLKGKGEIESDIKRTLAQSQAVQAQR